MVFSPGSPTLKTPTTLKLPRRIRRPPRLPKATLASASSSVTSGTSRQPPLRSPVLSSQVPLRPVLLAGSSTARLASSSNRRTDVKAVGSFWTRGVVVRHLCSGAARTANSSAPTQTSAFIQNGAKPSPRSNSSCTRTKTKIASSGLSPVTGASFTPNPPSLLCPAKPSSPVWRSCSRSPALAWMTRCSSLISCRRTPWTLSRPLSAPWPCPPRAATHRSSASTKTAPSAGSNSRTSTTRTARVGTSRANKSWNGTWRSINRTWSFSPETLSRATNSRVTNRCGASDRLARSSKSGTRPGRPSSATTTTARTRHLAARTTCWRR
mmetsp:Transcript_51248/g.120282  ORF Transcript_51248/g.120282 Transcript_51248/m.120282 type:complete len:324 (+) Transcript_51248:104-1075(+)